MLHISKQVDYAIQLVYALAALKKGEYLSLRMFSEKSNISFLFLQRIARSLKQARLLEASRGVHGGYFLIREANSITLKELIEAVEGPFGISKCMLKGAKKCVRADKCTNRPLMVQVNTQINNLLSQTYVMNPVK